MNAVSSPQADIERTLKILFESDAVVEMRAPKVKVRGYPRTYSGYFDDFSKLADAGYKLGETAPNVYVTLQTVKPGLLARAANRLESKPQATTSDNDITRYRWLLIDLDPTRPSGISASDEEKKVAHERARAVFGRMKKAGWPAPIVADSGNGWHLLYRIDLGVEDAGLVQKCLQALALLFDDEQVRVDQTCYNPARICKLYGTWARKGDSTEERPHRKSAVVSVPDDIDVVTKQQLANLASLAPSPESMKSFRAGKSDFDLAKWIHHQGFGIASGPLDWNGGTKWILTECPFNGEHTDRSAYIVQFASGAIAAGCHHNSCQGWSWNELREKYEPRESREAHNDQKTFAQNQLSRKVSPESAKEKEEQKQSDKSDFSNFRNFRAISNVAGIELDLLPIVPEKPASIAFPDTPLHSVIWAIQERSQAPYVLCAQSVLAAITLSVQHLADVAIPGIGGDGARRPISNYFMTIAKSGERKSSVDRLVLEEIEQHQLGLADGYLQAKRKYQAQFYQYEQLEREKIQTGQDLDEIGDAPKEPREPLMLVKEPTQEGLFRSLKKGQLSQGLFNDEGGSFIGGYGMSKDHRMRTAATFNALWDGSKLDRPRASEYESIRGRRFCVHLMIQPKASAQIVGDSMLADLGFNARCLIAEPESTIGTRKFREPKAAAFSICESFKEAISRCLRTKSEEDEHGLQLPILQLDPKARDLWISFYNEIEQALPERYATIQGFASKAPEHAIRLAAALTLFTSPKESGIPCAAMETGIDLVRFYLSEHLRLEVGRPDELDEATQLMMNWIRDKWGEPIISMADITRSGPPPIRKRKDAISAIEVAVETGHLRPLSGSHQVKGVTRRQCFEVVSDQGG